MKLSYTAGKHIGNVFSEGELDKVATVARFATTQQDPVC